MMSSRNDDVEFDDPANGIFSRTDYVADQPRSREFKPWHLPRKQFVRREQWREQAIRVLEGRTDTAPLKYLGLPGTDLLDLRYLHKEVCLPSERSLRFLGFNSEVRSSNNALSELNTSMDEVFRLDNIDSQSDVMRDDFRNLANRKSLAWKNAKRLGPFDIVNLDLCDGIATDSPEMQGSLYEAIAALVSLQVRSPNTWVMLVTSRIGKDHFHRDSLRKLVDKFKQSVGSCEGFATNCSRLLDIDDLEGIDPTHCESDVFFRLMLVSICRWIMALAQSQSLNRVELASCQAYRVNLGSLCNDLVSFALVFKPVIEAPEDIFQLTPTDNNQNDECSESARMAHRASKLIDVDQVLVDDVKLFNELVLETEQLLRAARYDLSSYRKWLTEK